MGNAIADLVQSKKALMAIAGVVAAGIGKLGLDMPPTEIVPILSPLIAYIVGQGIADHGKERAKIDAANTGS